MSQKKSKKKSGKEPSTSKVVLITAIISLIKAIIELIEKLIE